MRYCLLILFIAFNGILHSQSLPGSGNAYNSIGSNATAIIQNFDSLTPPLTLSVWVKHTPGNSTQNIFVSDVVVPPTGYHGFFFNINAANRVGIHSGSGNCYNSSCRLALRCPLPPHLFNEWVHVTAIINAPGNFEMYFNGVDVSSTGINDGTGAPVWVQSSNPTARIGSSIPQTGNPSFFKSNEIDELVIWNRALSVTEIRENMCRKVDTATAVGLHAYYKFDEASTAAPLTDHSGNGRDGVYTGGGSLVPSGAAIGDESDFDYQPQIGNSATHVNGFGDTLNFETTTSNNQMIQVFTVGEAPNHKNGLMEDSICIPDRYFGYYAQPTNAQTNGVSIEAKTSPRASVHYKRETNLGTPWAAGTQTVTPQGLEMSFSELTEEFMLYLGEDYESGLPDSLLVCEFPATLSANPIGGSGTILWDDNSTSPTRTINDPGIYHITATYSCGENVLNTVTDSVIVIYDGYSLDTAFTICSGDTAFFRGIPYYTTGVFNEIGPVTDGCDSLFEITVDVIQSEQDTIIQICEGDSVFALNEVFFEPGVFSVEYMRNNCVTNYTVTVQYVVDEEIDIRGPNLPICAGEDTVLIVTGIPAGAQVNWNTGETTQSITINEEGTYWVTYQGECEVLTDSITILEDPECELRIFVPSAFTPNGDGRNDLFQVKGNNIRLYKLYIVSRWGQVVFESNNINHHWDGTFKGNPVPAGVYTYKLLVNGIRQSRPIQKTGVIHLIR